ncbi:sigma-70 family RNA polymerase sigma factor, partial [Olleya sp. AH-315-F22]|nr:sigma-70 family RNA polymerase sigma factor [Olleya sp. AH-315-F22]
STWMYRIALNTAIAVYRKNVVQLDYKEYIPEQFHPSSKNEQSQNEERMYWALRQLNAAERAIVSLYLEDYSNDEIAEIVGITENYVGVRINRIKKKLKIILKT